MGVVIGVDAHKKTHTLVALDGNSRKLAEKTVEATDAGHATALHWALLKFGDDDLAWGIEDCRHVSARLERNLVTAGQRVARVPTRLMARSRASGRRPGKSDPIDAEAVARVVLREPDLPVACHDEVSRERNFWSTGARIWWVSARRQSIGLCGGYTNWTQHAHPAYWTIPSTAMRYGNGWPVSPVSSPSWRCRSLPTSRASPKTSTHWRSASPTGCAR